MLEVEVEVVVGVEVASSLLLAQAWYSSSV